jgi:hypothetical protein
MTSSDVITLGDEHREELVGLMRIAFNLDSGTLAESLDARLLLNLRLGREASRVSHLSGSVRFDVGELTKPCWLGVAASDTKDAIYPRAYGSFQKGPERVQSMKR